MRSRHRLRVAAVALAMALVDGVAVAATEGDRTMEDRCRQEVVELHRFFHDWFNAELADDAASFARLDGVLAADFEIIGPEGRRVERAALIPALRGGHGRHVGTSFAIEVRNVRSRRVGDGMVLVTYEEHQTSAREPRSWLSSALFRDRAGNPNGVEWVHVQETYLPADGS